MFLSKLFNLLSHNQQPDKDGKNIYSSFPVNKLIELYGQSGPAPKYLLYGDSVIERISRHDDDTRTLHKMIIDNLSGAQMGCIAHSAFHMGVFYMLTRAIEILKERPSVIILPVNMRSFSPQWDLFPGFQCSEHVNMIQEYILSKGGRINYSLFGIDMKKSNEEFFETRINYPLLDFRHIHEVTDVINNKEKYKDNNSTRLRVIFIYHYLYILSETHRKLILMNDLIRLSQKLNIMLIIYITPVNYMAGLKYVGNDFIKIFERNLQTVLRTVKSTKHINMLFDDYSMQFDSEFFFHENDATEHLNQKGRSKLAGLLSKHLTNKLLK